MDTTITIISYLFSGSVGVGISAWYYRRYEKRKQKYEVLRRIVGYRFVLVESKTFEVDMKTPEVVAQFFSALNEVMVIFHDSPEVIKALQDFHRDLKVPNRPNDNLVTLIKKMCKVLDIKNTELNDEFLLRPFCGRK